MKLDWVKNGEMNGTNEGVMKSLFHTLPSVNAVAAKDLVTLDMAHQYMAELWLRGVSKEEFIKWVNNEAKNTALDNT